MNDEPVAWINRFRDDGWLSWDKDDGADVSTPLYTRPSKQLSDEEITAIWQRDECYQNAQAFARAILRRSLSDPVD